MSSVTLSAVAALSNKAVIEVWKIEEEGHPYPWRFAVTHKGIRHQFSGLPNKCHSRRSAYMRAWWRARWLETGVYSQKYGF